ncbi:MAG: hypothetical protein LBT51_02600, partial [Fusobacteriaceae bacterium]|nr:hypothetical protein [Fusobacteriaceae bacterium]
ILSNKTPDGREIKGSKIPLVNGVLLTASLIDVPGSLIDVPLSLIGVPDSLIDVPECGEPLN